MEGCLISRYQIGSTRLSHALLSPPTCWWRSRVCKNNMLQTLACWFAVTINYRLSGGMQFCYTLAATAMMGTSSNNPKRFTMTWTYLYIGWQGKTKHEGSGWLSLLVDGWMNGYLISLSSLGVPMHWKRCLGTLQVDLTTILGTEIFELPNDLTVCTASVHQVLVWAQARLDVMIW